MDKNVYSTKSKVLLMGVKNLLESENIPCFEVNKLDSSYAGAFGNYQLMVEEKDEERAKELIQNFESDASEED
jgi:hypothetical protein